MTVDRRTIRPAVDRPAWHGRRGASCTALMSANWARAMRARSSRRRPSALAASLSRRWMMPGCLTPLMLEDHRRFRAFRAIDQRGPLVMPGGRGGRRDRYGSLDDHDLVVLIDDGQRDVLAFLAEARPGSAFQRDRVAALGDVIRDREWCARQWRPGHPRSALCRRKRACPSPWTAAAHRSSWFDTFLARDLDFPEFQILP